jgi:hypothetical protein
MQWLNVSYATYFNKKRQRSGHLFQGRFKAILVDADAYLEQLSRYIHLNPVQAKIVGTPVEYPWSSFPAFVGNFKKPEWLTTGEILNRFGKRKNTAIKNYRSFVEVFDIAALKDPGKETFGGFILGDTPFIKWVQNTFLSSQDNTQEIPELSKLQPRVPPAKILEGVCAEYKCKKENIVKKGGHRSQERAMAIYLARDLTGLPGKELGSFFGVSGAATTMRYKQFSREIRENQKLHKRVQILQKKILNS